MKHIAAFLIIVGVLTTTSCKPEYSLFEEAICIENITVIDPVDGRKDYQTVIIKNGKILRVGDTATLPLSPENTIIDGRGKYLIPGLWDAHVHFAYVEELAPRMFDLFLAHGVTSVRDTGGNVDFVKAWKDRALANPTDAPRVMMAGPLLDGEPNVYDGGDARHPELSVRLNSVDAVVENIEKLISKEVDFLKAYEMLSPDQFKKILELAKKNGLKVTGHVPLSMDVISASNAGMNSMEHLRNLELSCVANADDLLQERQELLRTGVGESGADLRAKVHKAQQETAIANFDAQIADQVLSVLKKNDTWQIPTLALNTFFSGKYYARESYQESYEFVPDSIGRYWKERSIALKAYPVSDFRKAYDKWNYMMVAKVHEKGIPIMAGTDTPIAFLTPGLSLHEELAALVKAGLSPLEALKSATINPARYFGLDDTLGTIAEGMRADLVILDADPLNNIRNTIRIHAVIKEGTLHDQEALAAKLDKLRKMN